MSAPLDTAEVRTGGGRPLPEEVHGARWHIERVNGHDVLAIDGERLTARREDVQLRAASGEGVDHAGHSLDHVLTVVDHQKRPLSGEEHPHRGQGFARAGGADRHCHRALDVVRAGNVGQGHEPHVGELAHQLSGGVDRQARLPDATDARKGHDTVRLHRRATGSRRLSVATNERRTLPREVVGVRVDAAEHRKPIRQRRVANLPDPLWLGQIARTGGCRGRPAVRDWAPSGRAQP